MLEDIVFDQNAEDDWIQNTVLPAKKSCELMKYTINNLIDYGNIQLGNFQKDFYEFDLSEVIEECCNLYEHQFRLKNISLETHIDNRINQMKVKSDPQLIKQILLNLINNSLKFTEEGEVKIRARLENENLIQVQIIDTGEGIKEQHIQYIQ